MVHYTFSRSPLPHQGIYKIMQGAVCSGESCLVLDPSACCVRLELSCWWQFIPPCFSGWFTVPCAKAGPQAGSWVLGQTWPGLLSAWEGVGLALFLWSAQQGWALSGFLRCDARSEQGHPSEQDFPSLFFPATTVLCILCNKKYWEKLSHLHLSDVIKHNFLMANLLRTINLSNNLCPQGWKISEIKLF